MILIVVPVAVGIILLAVVYRHRFRTQGGCACIRPLVSTSTVLHAVKYKTVWPPPPPPPPPPLLLPI